MVPIIEKVSGDCIGRCEPRNPYGWPEPEMGWALKPEF